MKEFELIERYFQQESLSWLNAFTSLGIGDDCAIINIPQEQALCLSMDTLLEDVHFPKNAKPYDIATRALCVTLSDLAAMGAKPLGFTLAIRLPSFEAKWLEAFTQGLSFIAQKFHCPLIGGDTTKGPLLVITIQVHGLTKKGKALKRSGAKAGDKVYVSGNLGDSAGALDIVLKEPRSTHVLAQRFNQPLPKIEFGQNLMTYASSCIDISDGLVQDLNHICKKSQVAMKIDRHKIPLSQNLLAHCSEQQALKFALTGGDDYQLAYTANHCENGIYIGEVMTALDSEDAKVSILGADFKQSGFQHF